MLRLTKQWRLYDIAVGSGTLCIILDIDNLQDIASHSVRNTAPVRYRVSWWKIRADWNVLNKSALRKAENMPLGSMMLVKVRLQTEVTTPWHRQHHHTVTPSKRHTATPLHRDTSTPWLTYLFYVIMVWPENKSYNRNAASRRVAFGKLLFWLVG